MLVSREQMLKDLETKMTETTTVLEELLKEVKSDEKRLLRKMVDQKMGEVRKVQPATRLGVDELIDVILEAVTTETLVPTEVPLSKLKKSREELEAAYERMQEMRKETSLIIQAAYEAMKFVRGAG